MNTMCVFYVSPFESEMDELEYEEEVKALRDDMQRLAAFAKTAAETMNQEVLMPHDTRTTLRALIEAARGKLIDAEARLDVIEASLADA